MVIVRQSTARTVTVGPILDADGVAVTDVVVGDLKIAKNGGAPAGLNGSATLTHRHTGHYSLALTASDTDTVGQAEVVIDDTTNAMPPKELTVVEEAIYDALFAASATGALPVSGTVTLADGGLTAAKIATDAITADKIAANAIGASELAADAVTEIQSGLATASALATAQADLDILTGTDGATLATAQGNYAPAKAGDAMALVNDAITSAKYDESTAFPLAQADTGSTAVARTGADSDTLETISDEIAAVQATANAIEADTQDLQTQVGTDGAGLTAVPWNADWDAQVQSEVQDAIEANHLDHLLAATYDPASKPGAADALLNELVENDGGVARFTANALEEAPTGGSAPTAGEIADAVWTEAIADHSGESGSTAEQLAAAGAAGDPWATALPGSYTAGQAGKIVGDNLNAPVGTVDTVVDAIKAVTDNLPDGGALSSLATAAALATVDSEIGVIDGIVDDILDDTGNTGVVVASGSKTGYSLATDQSGVTIGTVNALGTQAKADVNAEVDTAIGDAEPIESNVTQINDVPLTGDGTSGTPWGPA